MKVIKQFEYKPADVVGGYTDRILRVDMGTREIKIQQLPADFKTKYTGGRGYAIKLIWDETRAETRYDSPENILIMANGPLGNEPGFPGTGKFIAGTISPLTDTFIDSNVGGHFGPLLKLAGFDALAISGKSDEDLILIIDADAGSVSLTAVDKDSQPDEGALSFGEKLLKEAGKGIFSDNLAAVVAGEGAVNARFGILNSLYYDRRRNRIRSKQAGRGGTGTVMRAKGLSGVVVKSSRPKANGNNAIDKNLVREAGTKLKDTINKYDPVQLNLEAWGTTGLSEYMNKFHILPINNYQYGQSPAAPGIFAGVFLDKYFSKKMPDGCYYGCNLACAKGVENFVLQGGPRAGKTVSVDGPEYETVGAVTNMGIFDPQFVLEYNWYCDEYSLDTISTGVVIGFFMECFERGYLSTEDTGYELRFGNIESVEKILREIVHGRGFGKIAGQGIARGKKWVAQKYAARTGVSEESVLLEINKFAMEAKGLEFSMYVTKESLAQQGGYGFSLKGPQHDEAWLIFIDQVHKELPTFELKASALKWFPLIRTWFNATGLCKLPWIDVRNPEAAKTSEPAKNIPSLAYYVDYLNGTTGSKKTLQDVLDDSERLQLLQKLINLRQGKGTRSSDQIPWRAVGPVYMNEYHARTEYYEEWLKQNLKGAALPPTDEERHKLLMKKRLEAFSELCDHVYARKGYNSEAVPRRETVKKFDLLDEQADRLLSRFGE
ncbi:MAG TPA: aldehyde ferredoxin oxidoreductase C-terminal domain-containing protein [Dehalococcoidales bacterium]|nr:aldehyde ferredoxin oxidoreductase C-terminal domain-containing protein [Dehalococcoidales bacterium]